MNRKVLLSACIGGSMLAGLHPARADYASTVQSFHPVMYYRLNENAAVPISDQAVNLGSLGSTINGFYLGSVGVNYSHPVAGALAGSSDGAVQISGNTGGGGTSAAGQLLIPFVPGLNTPQFSAEAWLNPTDVDGTTGSPNHCAMASGDFAAPRAGWLVYQSGESWNLRMYAQNGTSTSLSISGGDAPVAGTWYHIVITFDGTTAKLYVNGAEVASGAPTGYVPATAGNFTIGTRSDSVFNWNGSADEVAMYPAALSAARVLAHYQYGTNPALSANYAAQVLADAPLGYWRVNEPTWMQPDPSTLPVATNSGSFASGADGAYGPGMLSGVAGVPFGGFEANNRAAFFNARAGSVAIPPQALATDTMTILGWLKRQGTQSLGALLFQRDAGNNGATGLQIWDGGGNNELRGNWNGNDWGTATGLTPPDGVWAFAAMVVTPTNTDLYLYDLHASLAAISGAPLTHPVHDFSVGSLLIGQDQCCGARIFKGAIDEVAVFDTALTAEQLKQIFYSANVPPIIVTQPPATNNVLVGAPVNIAVLASGTPTLGYQWRREGADLPGQTKAALTLNAALADSGNYTVVITNTYGAVTSTVANLTVTAIPAVLSRAVGFPTYDPVTKASSLTQVILEFSAPLSLSAISTPANYVISDGVNTLAVTGAAFTNANATVLLTTAPQAQNTRYTVTLNNIQDANGTVIVSPNNTAQFVSWVGGPANGVHVEIFDGSSGLGITNLTQNPDYPARPALLTNVWVCDSRAYYPDNTHINYGTRMRAVFTPPTSGNWVFYVRADDEAQLYLNPTGPGASDKTLIVSVPSCCENWSAHASAPFPMLAGQSYYLELLHKEGGGGDFVKIAAALQSSGAPANASDLVIDPASLAGPIVGYPYAPASSGGDLTLLSGPGNLSVEANTPVTFTCSVSAPADQTVQYQWTRNNVAIAGATGSSYAFIATTADNGMAYRVQAYILGSAVVSAPATLTVTANVTAPAVASVRGSTALNNVVVSFSRLVDAGQAQNPANYTLPGFTTSGALLDPTGLKVTVTFTAPLTPGQSYSLGVHNVTSPSGVPIVSTNVPFRAFVLSRGLVQWDYYGGIGMLDSGANIDLLLNNPKFPNYPDAVAFLEAFDSRLIFPDDTHDCYGTRISGVFLPPTSGDYMFYIRSDDNSQLYLNPSGADPAGKSQVTQETSCCHGFSATSAGPFTMTAGSMYYLETIQWEGVGGDYMKAATKLDADPTDPNSLMEIPGYMLGVLADPEGASVTITQNPSGFVGVYRGATPAATLLDATFNSTDGGFTTVNFGSPVGPWQYNATSGSWTNHGPSDCPSTGMAACGLNSPVLTVATGGSLVLTFAHRYSFEGFNSSDTVAWDGGQVRMSVNGGPFITVPASNFSANGYVAPIDGGIWPAVKLTPGWINRGFVGESTGYGSRTFLTSVADLGYFNAGDRVVLQFLASWDDCSEGTEPNWEIDSVRVTVGNAAPSTFYTWLSAGAQSTYQGQPNPYISYQWQRDSGSGFVDIPQICSPSSILPITVALTNNGTLYRCITYSPGAASTSAVVTASVKLALTATSDTSTITLAWPLPDSVPVASFILQRSASMEPAQWTEVPSSEFKTTATTVYVTVPKATAGATMFYRLRLR